MTHPSVHVPFLLGLTGNIACGKSSVGALLAARPEVDYVDADAQVHRLYEPGTPETVAIAARFGAHLLEPDGRINRRRLGDVVMADPAALAVLQALLAPGIQRLIQERLAQSPAPVVVFDAIRLIEAGYAPRCQAVWVVTCDRATQVARLCQSRGFTPEQAALRIDAQTPQADKLRFATTVVENTGDLPALAALVEAAWQRDVAPHLP